MVPPPPPPPPPGPPPLEIASSARLEHVVSSYRPTKVFRTAKHGAFYTSLDFDDTGSYLLTTSTDDVLQVYDCVTGAHHKTILSQKYGCDIGRFTHSKTSVLHTSTKADNTIRHLSIHDSSYLTYFTDHKRPVTCLELSPSSDTFVSCSQDNNVLLWSLNSKAPIARLQLTDPFLVAFDPSATVIAVAAPTYHSILFYDVRNVERAPFSTISIEKYLERFAPKQKGNIWQKIEFSNDGKHLLIATRAGHLILDAFGGELIAFIPLPDGATGRLGRGSKVDSQQENIATQGDVCFTPDGRFLLGGSGKQNMYLWDVQAQPDDQRILQPAHTLDFQHRAAVVAFNPKHHLCASADKELVLWIPDPDAMVS